MSPKYLILTADDLGYSEERNLGIYKCFVSSSITRASLLVNSLAAKHAMSLIDFNTYPVGLHFNLTEGMPISEPSIIKSLVNDVGFFHSRNIFFQNVANLNVKEVEIELTNQIEKFMQLTNGSLPNHIDGHQHVHIVPGVIDVVIKLMKRFSLSQTRLPYEPFALKYPWMENYKNKDFYNIVLTYCLNASFLFRKNNIRFSNFIGQSTMGINMTTDRLKRLILSYTDKISTNNDLIITNNYTDVTDKKAVSCDDYLANAINISSVGDKDFRQSNTDIDDKKIISCNNFFWNSDYMLNQKSDDNLAIFNKNNVIQDTMNDNSVSHSGEYVALDAVTLLTIDPSLDNCIVELMCHPGFICKDMVGGGCGAGADDFACSPDREHELQILQSEEMKLFYSRINLILIS